MQQVTLEQIKAAQQQVNDLIAAYESKPTLPNIFPVELTAPELLPGETWIATLVADDGKTKYHLTVLDGDNDEADWDTQMRWAKEQGGDLPDRVEQAILFKYAKHLFKGEAYWSNTQYSSLNAWYQDFDSGYQYYGNKSSELRARVVRRLPA